MIFIEIVYNVIILLMCFINSSTTPPKIPGPGLNIILREVSKMMSHATTRNVNQVYTRNVNWASSNGGNHLVGCINGLTLKKLLQKVSQRFIVV